MAQHQRHNLEKDCQPPWGTVSIETRVVLPVSVQDESGASRSVQAELITFCGPGFNGRDHFALFKAPKGNVAPLVRVHSACITGEVLNSRRCDCGPQLDFALQLILAEGGALIYLDQEGRGIGFAAKIKAYALQDRGFDTFEANRVLGFADDPRRFSVAAGMLSALNLRSVRLLTNNPSKVQSLLDLGINVIEHVRTPTFSTPENRQYLEAKRVKGGHLLDPPNAS